MTQYNELSALDVATLAGDPSPEARAAVGAKVASRFDNALITDRERSIAEAILCQLAKDTAVTVRQSLSKSLSCLPGAPKGVVLALACDIDEIALPVLENSPVLDDADLIEIVRGGSFAKQHAIAGRPEVSSDLAEALVATDNRKVVSRLVANEGAILTEETLVWVADRYAADELVAEPLAGRASLPISVVERVLTAVSEELRTYLIQKHGIKPDVAAQLIRDSHERNLVNFAGEIDPEEIPVLVNRLADSGRLTASLILRALCMGEAGFVEAAIIRLTDLAPVKIWMLLLDQGTLGMKALFARCRFPEDLLPGFRSAVEIYREMNYTGADDDKAHFRLVMLERLLTSQQGLEGDDLDFLVSRMSILSAQVHQDLSPHTH